MQASNPHRAQPWQGYFEALALVALATILRQAFHDYLGTLLPFFFFIVVVALVVWRRGTGPAAFAAVLGYVAAKALFLGGGFEKFSTNDAITAFAYVGTCSLLIASVHYLREKNHQFALQAIELQATRGKLDSALSTGRILAAEWDLSTDRVRFFGPSRELTGLDQDISFAQAFTTIHPDDVAPLQALIGSAVNEGKDFGCEIRFVIPETGKTVWSLVRGTPQRDESGKIVRVVGATMDITGYKEADNKKNEFLATLAHELRNPLAPIMSGIDLALLPGVSAETKRETFHMMQRQTVYITKLVDGLLDLTRVSRGTLKLNVEPCDFRCAVESAIEMVTPLSKSAGQTLNVDLPEQPLFVEGDAVRLSQTVGNLVMNAFKFTPDSGWIEVKLRREGNVACFEVSDSGIGIDPGQIDSVFDLFSQTQGKLTNRPVGLGVGLALCKEIVELHGGTISAASEGEGKGSRFTVRLPALAQQAVPTPAPEKAIVSDQRRRVLVVDDNKDAADVLGLLLKREGHDVAVCYNGNSALARQATFHADVMLIDLQMPEMDGFALAQRVRDAAKHDTPRLIALTGMGLDRDLAKTAEAGFEAHVVKPASVDSIRVLLGS